MTQTQLFSANISDVVQHVAKGKVTVCGDFCLDAYWFIDKEAKELSLETGLPIHKVRRVGYSPGGAGNVAMNLRSLGVAEVRAVGVLGRDMFGDELLRSLSAAGVDTSGFLRAEQWQTLVYAKPYLDGGELNRLDFGAFNAFPEELETALLAKLETAAQVSDMVVINQQIAGLMVTERLIVKINALAAKLPRVLFIADSRDYAQHFAGVMLKINTREAARVLGSPTHPGAVVSLDEAYGYATALSKRIGRPVVLTRGEHGLVTADGDQVFAVPGIQVLGKTDPVGAGDTVVAAIAAALAGGCPLTEAAGFANLAASVTVRKVQSTGTVSAAELLAAGAPDYIYEPELADSPRAARYLPDTEIEVVREKSRQGAVKYAIFDHDGTISTLRQGWEKIMEPMMLEAILGDQAASVPDHVYKKVVTEVKTFIDKTTGIQTLAQMKGLVGLVREHGFVSADKILDEHGYKAIYNEALLEMVRARVRKIERGELGPNDFEIKGARQFLTALHQAGVKLFLASGTDEADVQAEARVMGYADLFTGGIRGAVGDLKVEAKRMVLERIINSGGITGDDLVVVGDGPVELREGSKRGAFCLGIASNELCRYGLDLTKRARLIRAGADIVVPDFSQYKRILPLLGVQA
jgi:rfaE bifunctional protein kinase chain/domain